MLLIVALTLFVDMFLRNKYVEIVMEEGVKRLNKKFLLFSLLIVLIAIVLYFKFIDKYSIGYYKVISIKDLEEGYLKRYYEHPAYSKGYYKEGSILIIGPRAIDSGEILEGELIVAYPPELHISPAKEMLGDSDIYINRYLVTEENVTISFYPYKGYIPLSFNFTVPFNKEIELEIFATKDIIPNKVCGRNFSIDEFGWNISESSWNISDFVIEYSKCVWIIGYRETAIRGTYKDKIYFKFFSGISSPHKYGGSWRTNCFNTNDETFFNLTKNAICESISETACFDYTNTAEFKHKCLNGSFDKIERDYTISFGIYPEQCYIKVGDFNCSRQLF